MTIQIVESTTPNTIYSASELGVIAGKIYPRGMTTNSENGIVDYRTEALYAVFEAMQDVGMVLCLHGESPDPEVEVLDREAAFLSDLEYIATEFPKLRIVLEHVTTEMAVQKVKNLGSNVAATITLHHLFITLDDVIGGKIKPHYFCKPVAKRRSDRDALLAAAFSGNSKFRFGSDSASHAKSTKECEEGCAGVFTSPVIMPMLVELFDAFGKLELLENFTSRFGAEFFGLPLNDDAITLAKEPYAVPKEIPIAGMNDSVVIFNGGKTISWRVAD